MRSQEPTMYDLPTISQRDMAAVPELRGPDLTLPDHLAAKSWRLHQGKPDLRTGPQQEHDDVAALRAEIERLREMVRELAGKLHVLMLERVAERRGL